MRLWEERESTIIVPPGSHSHIDEALNLIVNLPVVDEGAATQSTSEEAAVN